MGVQVDAERHRRAMEYLDASVTGETEQAEAELLFNVCLDIPLLAPFVGERLGNEPSGSLAEWARATPLAKHALDVASMSINVGYDALTTIANLVLRGGAITQFGVFALTRQAAENAVLARWCVASTDPGELVTRGLAAMWRDMEDEGTFARSIGAPELIRKNDQYRARLLMEGRAQGLMEGKKGRSVPKRTQPFWTALFKEASLGGNGNLEWYYRSLSGASHGRPWAQLGMAHQQQILEHVTQDASGRIVPTGVVLVTSSPNVPLIGAAVMIAFDLVQRAVEAYLALNDAPAPPVGRWHPQPPVAAGEQE